MIGKPLLLLMQVLHLPEQRNHILPAEPCADCPGQQFNPADILPVGLLKPMKDTGVLCLKPCQHTGCIQLQYSGLPVRQKLSGFLLYDVPMVLRLRKQRAIFRIFSHVKPVGIHRRRIGQRPQDAGHAKDRGRRVLLPESEEICRLFIMSAQLLCSAFQLLEGRDSFLDAGCQSALFCLFLPNRFVGKYLCELPRMESETLRFPVLRNLPHQCRQGDGVISLVLIDLFLAQSLLPQEFSLFPISPCIRKQRQVQHALHAPCTLRCFLPCMADRRAELAVQRRHDALDIL